MERTEHKVPGFCCGNGGINGFQIAHFPDQNDIGILSQHTAEGFGKVRDVDAYLALRWEFYGTCYRASGRRRLVEEVERLYWRSERYNRLVLSTAQRFQDSFDRYTSFFASCEANDGEAAERGVQDALRWAVDSVAPGLPSETEFS